MKLGAKGVGEVKYNIDVESPAFDVLAGLARDYDVPMLCHFQVGMYNHGFDRFWRVLEKYHRHEIHRPRADDVDECEQSGRR